MLPGSSTSLTALFHGCGSHLKTTGMCSRRHGGGRVRSTTPAEDRYIVLSAKGNRRTTAQQVANQFLAASGKQISRKTVARHLRGGLKRTQTCCVCPIDQTARTARLQWCRASQLTEQDGHAYYSQMRVGSVCHRIVDANRSGARVVLAYRPENIQKRTDI
ncbi:hypothetical protein TNCV_2119591 [Trichonephila clavipes]|nr:hypothetical protein TNCV_2119591 [Trichonephila clavipes]